MLARVMAAAALAFAQGGGAGAGAGTYAQGGGAFGNWSQDASGLPSFAYTLDQTSAAGAKVAGLYAARVGTAMDQRHPTDHLFEFGNDRVVALTSTYGYTQVRHDERGPTLLNDFGTCVALRGAHPRPTNATLVPLPVRGPAGVLVC